MSNAPGLDSRHFDGVGGVIGADEKENPPHLASEADLNGRNERCSLCHDGWQN